MGRRSRRKVDAVIGVALVLGLIGSEMRPDGAITPGKAPNLLERTDAEMEAGESQSTGGSGGVVDQALVEELGRIKGLDGENIGLPATVEQKGGVLLPVLPMPVQKSAVRPDHCYSSFSGKDLVKQEPCLWQATTSPQPDPYQVPIQHYPVTEVQYLPSAFELLHERIGIGDSGHREFLQAELADLVAAIRPSSNEQSPISFSSAPGANPEELLSDLLTETKAQFGSFDEPPPPFSPKGFGLSDDPMSSLLDPSQDIFRWMEQSAFDSEGASSSQASDLFGQHLDQHPASSMSFISTKTDLPAATQSTERTIDELLHALESEEKSVPFGFGSMSASGYETASNDACDPFFSASYCDPVPTLVPTDQLLLSHQQQNMSRKREYESSWSSGASSSSNCGFESAMADYHNHTYDDGAAERRAKKIARIRSSSDDGSAIGGPVRCRDIQDFADLCIPFSYDAVISAEPSAFNAMVSDHRLNDDQRTLMRAARRRAKNRNAARQCRQRRVDEVEELADEVEGLEDERNQLEAENSQIAAEIAAQRAANERLQAFIIEAYTQMRPPSIPDAEYRLQSTRNGSFSLVEQRGIRA